MTDRDCPSRTRQQCPRTGWPDEQTHTWLLDRATTDTADDVRQAAVQALASGWPDEQTHTLLLDRATTDTDYAVRLAAVQALASGWPDEQTHTLLSSQWRK